MMHTLRFLSKSRSKGKANKGLPSSASASSLGEEPSAPARRLPTTKPTVSSSLATSTTAPQVGTTSSLESFSDGFTHSVYTTPPRSTEQSQVGLDLEKEQAAEDTDYAVVRPVGEKPQEGEWTQLELAAPTEDAAARRVQEEVNNAVQQALADAETRIHAIEQKHDEETRTLKADSEAARTQAELLERALEDLQQRFDNDQESTQKQIQDLMEALDHTRDEVADAHQLAEDRVQRLEASLAEAQEECMSKADVVSQLESTVEDLQSEVDYLSSQNISLTDETSALERKLALETDKLQCDLENERSAQTHRIQELVEEIKTLEKKNLEQRFTILELEDTMAHVEEEARTVRTTNKDLRTILSRYESKMADDKLAIDERNGRIDVLSRSSTHMTAELVQLQEAVNASNRQNRMLVDQLRQQSSDMAASKSLNRPQGHVARIGRGFQGGNTTRVDAAIRTTNILNEEVFQLCASMTDQLENIAKRFVADDGGRLAMAENLKPMLGTELVRYLQRHAQSTTPVEESKLAIIQVALQGCLIACCMRIITSWYPNNWEYGDFLSALYERIRGALGEGAAASWRETTMKCCARPSDSGVINKLTMYLAKHVEGTLSVSGWSKQEKVEQAMNASMPKLREIATLAARLSSLISTGAAGELEGRVVKPGAIFDQMAMENHDNPLGGGRRAARDVSAKEHVVCTIALGLSSNDAVDVGVTMIHLKPQVVLQSSLV